LAATLPHGGHSTATPRAGTPGRPLLAIYMHLDFQMLLI